MNTASPDVEATKDVIMSKIADLRKMAEEAVAHLTARKNVAEWVADKLRKLADLEPHEWDRSTLTELAEALTELAEALTSSPRLKGGV